MKSLQVCLGAAVSMILSGCGDDEAGDKYQYDMGRAVEHAPRISDDEADGQKLGGAEAVLLSAPSARKYVQDAWLVGKSWELVAQWNQSRSNAEFSLGPIRQGLCQIKAGELHARADDVCGWGSYLKPEGIWLANNIALLSLNSSREFTLDQLNVAERHACIVFGNYRRSHPRDKVLYPELARCESVAQNGKT